MKLSLLDGEAGFQMQGVSASDHAGFCVRGAGDVNGDGVSDLVLSGYFGLGDGAFGEAYVVFGRSEGYPASMELHMLDGRRDGFAVFGALGEGVIASVAGGDFNGDSVSEVLIGAPFAGGRRGWERCGVRCVWQGVCVACDERDFGEATLMRLAAE